MSLWYLTGTVTLTSGSNDVTGVGTAWLTGANAKAADIFYAPAGGMYEIFSVSAEGALRLVTPYIGPTLTGVAYAIISTQGFNTSLAMAMTQLIPELAQIRDAYAAGVDPASAAAQAAASASAAAAAALASAQQAASSGGGAAINDGATATNSTWSSNKTNTAIAATVAGLINDLSTASTSKTLSGSKINDLITAAKTAVKNDLTAGASSALDTLTELAQALGNDPSFAATLSTSLANRLRTDSAAQGLSPTQRANAIANLGVADALARVLPPSGSPGQVPVRTTNGYDWVDVSTAGTTEDGVVALMLSISSYARTETFLLQNGG